VDEKKLNREYPFIARAASWRLQPHGMVILTLLMHKSFRAMTWVLAPTNALFINKFPFILDQLV